MSKTKMSETEEKNDPLKEFYFYNTYPDPASDNNIKAKKMMSNVYYDLKPFSAYIRTSIDYLNKSATEGADVVIAKTEEAYLVPQFTIIKPHLPKNQFEVEKPRDVYVLSAEEDFDTDTFEVIHRSGTICTCENRLDTYNGSVFVNISEDDERLKRDIKFDLYDDDKHKNESIKCTIHPVSYKDYDTYRIDLMGGVRHCLWTKRMINLFFRLKKILVRSKKSLCLIKSCQS